MVSLALSVSDGGKSSIWEEKIPIVLQEDAFLASAPLENSSLP